MIIWHQILAVFNRNPRLSISIRGVPCTPGSDHGDMAARELVIVRVKFTTRENKIPIWVSMDCRRYAEHS